MNTAYRQTDELNQDALKVLESNQMLHMYSQLRRGARRFLNKAIRINQGGQPFTVSDFPELSKSVRKGYVFVLRHAGFIETLRTSGYAYYRVKGFRLDNFWDKVTPNPTGDTITTSTLQDELHQVLEEYLKELDSPALHNIRLHLYDDYVYEIIKQKTKDQNCFDIDYNESNKSFTIKLPIFGFKEYGITIILTPTKLIQVLIKNTFKPIVYDENGLQILVSLLGEIRRYLTSFSSDIPPVLDWLFVRADFGRDCKKPLNKPTPTLQFKHFSGALLRTYAKRWEDGSRKIRVEEIISPKKPVKEIIVDCLKSKAR